MIRKDTTMNATKYEITAYAVSHTLGIITKTRLGLGVMFLLLRQLQ